MVKPPDRGPDVDERCPLCESPLAEVLGRFLPVRFTVTEEDEGRSRVEAARA